jgi:hypothetical protein
MCVCLCIYFTYNINIDILMHTVSSIQPVHVYLATFSFLYAELFPTFYKTALYVIV